VFEAANSGRESQLYSAVTKQSRNVLMMNTTVTDINVIVREVRTAHEGPSTHVRTTLPIAGAAMFHRHCLQLMNDQ